MDGASREVTSGMKGQEPQAPGLSRRSLWRHPEGPRSHRRAEGSGAQRRDTPREIPRSASLRSPPAEAEGLPENDSARDDALTNGGRHA
jgi:hypothetical protein